MKGHNREQGSSGGGGNGANKGDPDNLLTPDESSLNDWQQDKLISDIEAELGDAGVLPQDLVVFWGFAADATRKHYARLYLSMQFNEYIEFRQKDMVFCKDMGGQDRPFSGVVVWLKRSASIDHVRLESLDLQKNFLQSTIPPTSGSAGSAGAGAGSVLCGGGGTILCGGGGTILCGGGGTILCGGGGTILCGGGGTILCGGGGSMMCPP